RADGTPAALFVDRRPGYALLKIVQRAVFGRDDPFAVQVRHAPEPVDDGEAQAALGFEPGFGGRRYSGIVVGRQGLLGSVAVERDDLLVLDADEQAPRLVLRALGLGAGRDHAEAVYCREMARRHQAIVDRLDHEPSGGVDQAPFAVLLRQRTVAVE